MPIFPLSVCAVEIFSLFKCGSPILWLWSRELSFRGRME
jgi:hypothetical protein